MLKEAIACYMKTTQINQTDYRGFFALAQAYSQDVNDQMAYYFFMRTLSIQYDLPKQFFVGSNFREGGLLWEIFSQRETRIKRRWMHFNEASDVWNLMKRNRVCACFDCVRCNFAKGRKRAKIL